MNKFRKGIFRTSKFSIKGYVLTVITLIAFFLAVPAGVVTSDVLDYRSFRPTLEERIDPITKSAYPLVSGATMKKFIMSRNPKIYDRLAEEILSALYLGVEKYNIPVIVGISLMEVESTFNQYAVSNAGAIGLLQVMPEIREDKNLWLQELIQKGIVKDRRDLYDPIKNIDAGYYVLNQYVQITGSLDAALARYLGAANKEYQNKVKSNIGNLVMMGIEERLEFARLDP